MFKFFKAVKKAEKGLHNFKFKFFHEGLSDTIKVSEEILQSLLKKDPVVALESTVITHGLPYPENLKTANRVEEIVRKNNAIPATIGIIEGNIHVGLTTQQLEFLADKNQKLIKISRRDMPYVLSQRLSGGTTVAATMVIAHKVGIPIFVTGGIGGVHRGAENSMDISADLYELSRTPMTVVSAGVKSILDIGRTLEYLETLGVCVATFGSSKEFPSFFTRSSRFFSPCNVESDLDAASLIDCRDKLQLDSGILIAVPIPEKYSEDGNRIENVIEQAVKEACAENVKGKDVTPFVLNKVRELSGGSSLKANIVLLENNSEVGSRIAVQLSHFKKRRGDGRFSPRVMRAPVKHQPKNTISSIGRPVVIGGSILDIHVKVKEEDVRLDGRTMEGCVESTAGGVGRNVADCLTRLQLNPLLISSIGAEEHANSLLDKMNHMDKRGVQVISDSRTATCVVILDQNGECLFAVGDMDVHNSISPQQVESHKDIICSAPLVVIDGNIPHETMDFTFAICQDKRIPVWFEPTDLSKAFHPIRSSNNWKSVIAYATPNLNELRVMHQAVFGNEHMTKRGMSSCLEHVVDECVHLSVPLLNISRLHTLFITLGAHGVVLVTKIPLGIPFPLAKAHEPKDKVRAVHYPASKPECLVSVSGAGDCFAAALICGILHGLSPDECIKSGQRAALLSLHSHHAVPNSIEPNIIFSNNIPMSSGSVVL